MTARPASPPRKVADVGNVQWEDPPPKKKPPGAARIWDGLLLPLMARPGVWARVRTTKHRRSAASAASLLRTGKISIPAGRWEFTARDVDGAGAVYARYLGPVES